MYDDHAYCDDCGVHSAFCWCMNERARANPASTECFIPDDHTDTPIFDQTRQDLRRAV